MITTTDLHAAFRMAEAVDTELTLAGWINLETQGLPIVEAEAVAAECRQAWEEYHGDL